MDKILKKKPFIVRYRSYVMGGVVFTAFLIYVIISSMGGRKLRTEMDKLTIEVVAQDKFLEYVDAEGIVQPILTLKVNTNEGGSVARIVGEEGMMMEKGDTILVLTNPELMRTIEEYRDELNKQMVGFREKAIEMEQKSLNLKQQVLQATYELKRLEKSFALDEEEFRMGIKSKAQLEVAKDEFEYKQKSTALQLEGLRHDSVVTVIRKELMQSDISREKKKFERVCERMDKLIVRAPMSGQLSFIKVTPGQQVGTNESIGEIKVLEQFKIHTSLSEYYIDRITTGLPATVNYQNRKYPLKITRVVPEVKDRIFDVDLVFCGEMPENVRIGKSYRVQIELGQPEDAVIIPKGNFFQYTGGQWIYKLDESGNRAVKVPISVGRQNPRQYEIIEGLKAGDRVVTTGYEGFGEVEELILK